MWESGLKTGGRYAIFWVLEVKRSKTLQKLNIQDCFCLHSWFHSFMTFLAQKLIYAINKQFWARSSIKPNYFRSSCEIITYMRTYFRTETQDIAQNLIDDLFLNWLSEKKWQKYGGTELFSEKTEAMHAELNKRAEAAISSYSSVVDFWYYI